MTNETDDTVHVPDPELTTAIAVVIDRLINDSEYRWGWWCNLVMTSIDAGASREIAEKGAINFLGALTGGVLRMWEDPAVLSDRLDRAIIKLNELIGYGHPWCEAVRTELKIIKSIQTHGRQGHLAQLQRDLFNQVNSGTISRTWLDQVDAAFNELCCAYNAKFPVPSPDEQNSQPGD